MQSLAICDFEIAAIRVTKLTSSQTAPDVLANTTRDLHGRMLEMGDQFLSSAGTGGNCACPMRLPDPSPVLDKNCAPIGPEILSSTGAGVWRKAPMAFPDSSSVLDKF